MVLAAQAMADAEGIALTVDGADRKGRSTARSPRGGLEGKPLTIGNPAGAAQVVSPSSGIPTAPEPAPKQGFGLERELYTMTARRPIRPGCARTSALSWC